MKHLSKAHCDWLLATIVNGQQLIADLERELNSERGLDEESLMKRMYLMFGFGMSAPTPPDLSKREDE